MINAEKTLAEKAREWFSSPEGKESVEKAIDRAVKNAERYRKLRQISPERLWKPFTI